MTVYTLFFVKAVQFWPSVLLWAMYYSICSTERSWVSVDWQCDVQTLTTALLSV